MSAFKKLRHIFNRAVSSTPAIIASGVLSLGIGWEVANNFEVRHSTAPPVVDVQMHDEAVARLQSMTAEIMEEQERLNANAQTLLYAQRNIGAHESAPLAQQIADLQAAQDNQAASEKAQQQRLHDFRKALWFSAAISEKEADKIYTDLFYAARDKGFMNIPAFFSPMTDALTFRDEINAKAKLPQDPAQISNAAAERVLEQARARDADHDYGQLFVGAGAAFGGGILSLIMISLGFTGRRREEEETHSPEQERARKTAPKPAPEQDIAPLRQEVKKPNPPGKFSL